MGNIGERNGFRVVHIYKMLKNDNMRLSSRIGQQGDWREDYMGGAGVFGTYIAV